MKILVTNDDGIFAPGLWALVKELKNIAEVVVVAPDREQSAIGTAVTLSQPLRMRPVSPLVPDVEAYSVEGTPADSVILALEKLFKDKIDLVVSGVNQGLNVGDDVFISGTVGAAVQGYVRGLPVIAVSIAQTDSSHLDGAAKVAGLLVEKIGSNVLSLNIFLNVNLPAHPLAEIKGVKVTRLASRSHTETVKEGYDGKRKYYWLVRQRVNQDSDRATDTWAIEQGNVSITPLHAYLDDNSSPAVTESFCSDLFQALQKKRE